MRKQRQRTKSVKTEQRSGIYILRKSLRRQSSGKQLPLLPPKIFMREIFLILSMLLLGLFSAKAFASYVPTPQDSTLLISLEEKITIVATNNSPKLDSIQQKLGPIITALSPDTQARYILSQLSILITESKATTALSLSPEMIKVLAGQFQ